MVKTLKPETKEQIISLIKEGVSDKEIAGRFDLAARTIYRYRTGFVKKPGKYVKVNKTVVRSMLKRGDSVEKVAEHFSVSTRTIYTHRKIFRIDPVEQLKAKIEELDNLDLPVSEIAARLNICRKTAAKYLPVKSMYKFKNLETGEEAEVPRDAEGLQAFCNKHDLSAGTLRQVWYQSYERIYQHRGWVPVFPPGSEAEAKYQKRSEDREAKRLQQKRDKQASFNSMCQRKAQEQEPKTHPWKTKQCS